MCEFCSPDGSDCCVCGHRKPVSPVRVNRSIRHLLGCTIVTVEDSDQRSRLIIRGHWPNTNAIAYAVYSGKETRAVVRLK